MKSETFFQILFLVSLIFLVGSCNNIKNSKKFVIASPTVNPVIGIDETMTTLPFIQEFLDYYLESRSHAKPDYISIKEALNKPGPKLILCSLETAKKADINLPDKEIEFDGFHLFTKFDQNGYPVVYCIGKNANGIKLAVYRLIHELAYHEKTLSFTHPFELSITPFYENRVEFQVRTRDLGDSIANLKYSWRLWNDDKVLALARLHDYFGFNVSEKSGMLTDLRELQDERRLELIIKWLKEKHRLGGKTLLFLWGSTISTDGGLKEIDLHTKEGANTIIDHYKRRAQILAPHADAFVSHWADPGVPIDTKADIKTPQRFHLKMLEEMRAYNPEIEGFFSIWFFQPNMDNVYDRGKNYWRWLNTDGIEDILDANILPPEIGVWVGDPSNFDPEYCRKIIETGRTLGIWTWYLGDQEIRMGLHSHWEKVAEYFKNQSLEDYAKNIKWHQLELNRCGDWNTISMVVGGAMMIDPQGDAESYAKEFCASIVGYDNVDIVMDVLNDIAQTRCFYHRNVGENIRFHDLAGWGSIDPEADINRIKLSLEKLKKVEIPDDFIPKIPYIELIYDSNVMIADIEKSLINILKHNEARKKLLAVVTTVEFKSLSESIMQDSIKSLSQRIKPEFITEGIGTCPEIFIWNRLTRNGILDATFGFGTFNYGIGIKTPDFQSDSVHHNIRELHKILNGTGLIPSKPPSAIDIPTDY